MEQEIATQVVGLGGATDFSLWQLFLRADFVVKSVIIILIFSSIFSWALIFEKVRLFRRINKSTQLFEDKFWKTKSAEAFYKKSISCKIWKIPNANSIFAKNIFHENMLSRNVDFPKGNQWFWSTFLPKTRNEIFSRNFRKCT